MSQNKFITIKDLAEEFEDLTGSELSAPLVALDENGIRRYVSEWGIHQTLDEPDGFEGFSNHVKTSRLVFKLGDIVDD
jgi:hypothetical protein